MANQLANSFKSEGKELAKGDIAVVDVSSEAGMSSDRREREYKAPQARTLRGCRRTAENTAENTSRAKREHISSEARTPLERSENTSRAK